MKPLADILWEANQDLAIASLENPFVQGIANGTLPPSTFAYYVGQDAFFLEAFARAYSIAAAKAPDWDSFGIFHRLADGVFEELKLHQSYADAWNVDLKVVTPGSATRRYTDFLLTTAWSSGVGVTTCAMLPCMRLYAFLGQTLAKGDRPAHAYTDWIQTYSGPDFDELAQQLATLANTYASNSDAEQAAYRYAMQCEFDFFQAAWDMETTGAGR
ncbi:MAG: TenA family protein [Leptolyngbyaceae bacterium]|nr:TenA family protein [Leptolyngbyaceae bacterium]